MKIKNWFGGTKALPNEAELRDEYWDKVGRIAARCMTIKDAEKRMERVEEYVGDALTRMDQLMVLRYTKHPDALGTDFGGMNVDSIKTVDYVRTIAFAAMRADVLKAANASHEIIKDEPRRRKDRIRQAGALRCALPACNHASDRPGCRQSLFARGFGRSSPVDAEIDPLCEE